MKKFQTIRNSILDRLYVYWSLIKGLQTGLLLLTGLAGYSSARCPVLTWQTLLPLGGSLFLVISGSTILNMWYDRDIDARMARTCRRPLPSRQVSVLETLSLGLVLSLLGLGWAFTLSPLYGVIIFAGLFFNLLVYTIWLKRRTAWSILWGGIAGGMPILAGRALAMEQIDLIGLLLSLAVLLWIPTHIMTFSIRYEEDYQNTGIPVFPSVYGVQLTRLIIALSSIVASIAMLGATIGLGMAWGYLRLLGVLSVGLLLLAIASLIRPSERLNFGLFKYASLFMLSSMVLILVEGF